MLLLHTCCAPCVLPILENLANDYQKRNLSLSSQVALYFYNPNIFPKLEYSKRQAEVKRVAKIYSVKVYYDAYDHIQWLAYLKRALPLPLADYQENSWRCQKCFYWRLRQSFLFAKTHHFNQVATTLSVNLFKDTRFINESGYALSRQYKKHPIKYVTFGLSPQKARQREKELVSLYHIYHQNYCGCEFSIKKI